MSADLEFKGLEDFLHKLERVSNTYSDTTEKYLNRTGNQLKKAAKAASPDSGSEHKKKLAKSWKSKVTGLSGGELEYQLRNTAPHFHLVERGHVKKTPSGKAVGFIQGTHFFEKTVKEFENSGIVERELQKFMEDVKRKVQG